ncbi:MAG TPA: organomercurial lyase [Mycobacteriales bacterium]|nr:organomercurial lyase [Mycobacteriales bacterium]
MDARQSDVRRVLYDTLAAEGRAPSVREVARAAGLTVVDAQATLGELAQRHALVLTQDGDAVRMAHPFSAAPMGFVVTADSPADDRMWWGGCAWDSFGISAALGVDVWIATSCPGCGARLDYAAGPSLPPTADLVVHFLVPARSWWSDVVRTCSHIRAFCDPTHVDAWCSSTGEPRGEIVALADVWRLAQPWYGDRLAPDYAPRPVERSQQLLAAVGLTGEFWQLPG